MIQVNVNSSEYGEFISSYISRQLPAIAAGKPSTILDAVVAEIIGTKQHRVGPTPSPESLVMIRDVVREAIANELPIPILTPVGAAKRNNDGGRLDLAELLVLRILQCLQDRVQRWYEPGILVSMKQEDNTRRIVADRVPRLEETIYAYSSGFRNLNRILGTDAFVKMVYESDMVSFARWKEQVDRDAPYFLDYIRSSGVPERQDKGWDNFLKNNTGWVGGIPDEQINWFRDRYVKDYPDLSPAARDAVMARYLASTLAKRKLNATGAMPGWTKYIELSWVPKMPYNWTDAARVYYRSIPLAESSNNILFWSAHGIICINGADAHARLLNWWDKSVDLVKNDVTLSADGLSVTLGADYTVEA